MKSFQINRLFNSSEKIVQLPGCQCPGRQADLGGAAKWHPGPEEPGKAVAAGTTRGLIAIVHPEGASRCGVNVPDERRLEVSDR
jgi:hypothetical protein